MPVSRLTSFGRALAAVAASALLCGTAAAQSSAQSWPSKPVTIVQGFPAGSGIDIVARLIQGPLEKALGTTIVFDYKIDDEGLGKGGTGVLLVDGKEVARNSLDHGTPITFPEDETFDIGEDTRTGVAMAEHRYDTPFKFTGKIDKLTFNLAP